MIDMHTHILPGVDNGARDMDEAIKMIHTEIKNGVKTIVLTPHISTKSIVGNNKKIILDRFHQLCDATKDLDCRLLLGAEIFYTPGILNRLNSNELFTINRTKYVLLEFNIVFENEDIDEIAYDFVASGYKPIISHAERYPYITLEKIRQIHQTGALIQINSNSILGINGRDIKKLCKRMLKEGLVDFIASDCHDNRIRKPNLKAVKRIIKRNKSIIKDEIIFN